MYWGYPELQSKILIAIFGKTIEIPPKFERMQDNTGFPTRDYMRFWDDINKYSIAYVGMPYSELTGMRDTLGLKVQDLKTMMASHEAKKSGVIKSIKLELPEGIEDIAMPLLGT